MRAWFAAIGCLLALALTCASCGPTSQNHASFVPSVGSDGGGGGGGGGGGSGM
jgi:hypothetical protein